MPTQSLTARIAFIGPILLASIIPLYSQQAIAPRNLQPQEIFHLPQVGAMLQPQGENKSTTIPVTTDKEIAAAVDKITATVLSAQQLGGALLIARGDRIILQRAYGFADWELQSPNSAKTRFGIASITKVMTEALANLLASEGRLDLDAPVSKYIPGFPHGEAQGRPTVRDLMTHRAGVPHRVTTAEDETRTLRPSDIVERAIAKGLLFEPGSQELYSSAGFTCLARVIEIVEGKPFHEVLKTRIFQPAAMTSAIEETGQQLMAQRATPYHLGTAAGAVVVANEEHQDLSFLTGAGSTYSTTADMFHLVRAMHSGILGEAAKRELTKDTVSGWQGWYGRANGYEGSIDYLSNLDLTFVFLSNLRSAANWQVRRQVKNAILGKKFEIVNAAPPVMPSFELPSSIVGQYGDPSDPLMITTDDGRLFRDGDEFYPIEDGWYYEGVSSAIMRFRRAADGSVDAIITRFFGREESVKPRIHTH